METHLMNTQIVNVVAKMPTLANVNGTWKWNERKDERLHKWQKCDVQSFTFCTLLKRYKKKKCGKKMRQMERPECRISLPHTTILNFWLALNGDVKTSLLVKLFNNLLRSQYEKLLRFEVVWMVMSLEASKFNIVKTKSIFFPLAFIKKPRGNIYLLATQTKHHKSSVVCIGVRVCVCVFVCRPFRFITSIRLHLYSEKDWL